MRKITEDFIGTCQACFGEFKVNETSQLIALHGYQRPGDGFIIGQCTGTDHAPFEYDTKLTVQIIEQHRIAAVQQQVRQSELSALGFAGPLTRRWQEYNRTTQRHDEKSEPVTPGHEHWSYVLKAAIQTAIGRHIYHTQVADFLEAKVKAWKRGQIVGIDVPATGLARTLRKAYDPAEAKLEEERAAAKAARDAKPGKLKVIFYQPAVARDPNGYNGNDTAWRKWLTAKDAQEAKFVADIKAWVKANITGKAIVRKEYDSALPRSIRNDGRDFDVVVVSLPWDYRFEITNMFSSAVAYETENKKKSFTVAGPARPH